MRILVTGGAGYIGSVTTRMLLDAGHECVVLDTLENGHREAVDSRATLLVGDVGDRRLLDSVLPDCDAVMHLAGYIEVAESVADPGRYMDNNAVKPAAMLRAMVAHGVGSIVFSSTAAVYGDPALVPIPEDAPTVPVNPYGTSKLAFEGYLEQCAAEHGMRSVRLRYFNVAGAWPDGSLGEAHTPETHIVPRVLSAMVAGQVRFEVYGDDYDTPDGTCVRDYIHVCDLGLAHRLALEALGSEVWATGSGDAPVGAGAHLTDVYNLGNGVGYSNLEVVRACAEITGRDVEIAVGPRRAGDPARLVASSERARARLGWAPERGDLRTMIADAWRWHSAHPGGYA
ncbi:MAG TPA: UDP-glucose 4-epimerase GalE [Coriobacteriia bacterium]